jgi:hypothetical protein
MKLCECKVPSRISWNGRKTRIKKRIEGRIMEKRRLFNGLAASLAVLLLA